MKRSRRPAPDALRKKRFRETVRDILRMDHVKKQFGGAVDTAGALARVMEQAYRMGFEAASTDLSPASPRIEEANGLASHHEEDPHALSWTLIPARTRNTFWSICLAALGREGRTATPSYLEPVPTRRGTLAWQLVVPDRRTYERTVGDGTIVTLTRLQLVAKAPDESRVTLTDYGIRTWNRFCERGGHWPDDLVEKLP